MREAVETAMEAIIEAIARRLYLVRYQTPPLSDAAWESQRDAARAALDAALAAGCLLPPDGVKDEAVVEAMAKASLAARGKALDGMRPEDMQAEHLHLLYAKAGLEAAKGAGCLLPEQMEQVPHYAAHPPTDDAPDWEIESDVKLPQGKWRAVFILKGANE